MHELDLQRKQKEKNRENDNLILKIQQNAGDDDEIKKIYVQLEDSNNDFRNFKTAKEIEFVANCVQTFKSTDYFGINEDKSLALNMICSDKTKENIISIFPSPEENYTFKGVDFSGLSVQLFWFEGEHFQNKYMMNFFLRPDTFFLKDGCKPTNSFISNNVNRNILTRYNDEILMGFLI